MHFNKLHRHVIIEKFGCYSDIYEELLSSCSFKEGDTVNVIYGDNVNNLSVQGFLLESFHSVVHYRNGKLNNNIRRRRVVDHSYGLNNYKDHNGYTNKTVCFKFVELILKNGAYTQFEDDIKGNKLIFIVSSRFVLIEKHIVSVF